MPEASVADVVKLIEERVAQLPDERVPLAEARQRVLQADVLADADQPPFDRSAMDGYAFIPGSFPAKLRVIGTVKAGEVAARAPGPGEALRIFTGAAVPAPGLAVAMQEDVRVEGDFIIVERAHQPGENVRLRGSDARQGDVLVPKETLLGPVALALLASIGELHPLVNPAPRVVHATTGDEIVPPETTPGPGQIRNSNQILIKTLLQNMNVPSAHIHQEHWGDDSARAAARMATEPFASADMILISGGASVGEHDYTARLLEGAGFDLEVRRVNMRPGRPLLVGFRGRQIAFGLPGNPVSQLVCFYLFVHHALARMRRWTMSEWNPRPLLGPLVNCANRRPTYWPARLESDPVNRRWVVRPLAWNNSGHLAAMIGAHNLIMVPPDTKELPAGAMVDTFSIHFG